MFVVAANWLPITGIVIGALLLLCVVCAAIDFLWSRKVAVFTAVLAFGIALLTLGVHFH
jgi:uncharacterized membrane protein YkgB